MFYQKHFPCFAAGKPRYTVPQNILSTKKRIFLVAVPLMNQTSASDNSLVKLRFHHTLTRIAIYVKSDDNTTGKQITAFSIRGMKNGILTCHIPEDSSTPAGYPRSHCSRWWKMRCTTALRTNGERV